MAGASVNLDAGTASILRDALDSLIYLASGLTAVIFDAGASISISNNAADFPDGIEPCEAELQGIGAGLSVRGKGKCDGSFRRLGVDLLQLKAWCTMSRLSNSICSPLNPF